MASVLLILILFARVTTLLGQDCPAQGISSHVVLDRGNYRLTTLKRGNYTIQGLTSFTKWRPCKEVNDLGLISSYAMQYAIDKVNNDSSLMPYATLGLQLDSVCGNLTLTMARGIEAVSLHRSNSVCRADFLKCDKSQNLSRNDIKPITALVGTELSSTSIPLASLLSLYYIPQVSFAASSRLLSKKDLYKSFFRTIPSDTKQIKVVLEIIQKFEWNYVFAIGSDDDYGKLGISELKQSAHAQAKNICIAHDEYIPVAETKQKEKINAIMDQLVKSENKAQVVVLFCYPRMGKMVLQKAKERGIKRVWLTSESWNPSALHILEDKNNSLVNESVGVLTVSLKTYPMSFIFDYIRREITERFQCNMWLQNFLRQPKAKGGFACQPERLSADKSSLNGSGTGCPCKIDDIIDRLKSKVQGTIYNVVDSVTALAHAINSYLRKECSNPGSPCIVDKIPSRNLTNEMFNVSFMNENGKEISFDENGDPRFAYYTIENIVLENGTYQYHEVGDWDERRDSKLNLNESAIQWPRWFKRTKTRPHPISRCSEDCPKSHHKMGIQGCCWICRKCEEGTYSDTVNAITCKKCPKGYHTKDNIECTETPIRWLKINDPAGMAIVIISLLGGVIIVVASLILLKFRMIVVRDTAASPHFVMLSCVLVFLTFAYGLLHVVKPTQQLCEAVNALFFLFLMLYTAIVMVKTKFFTKYLVDHSKTWLKMSLFTAQMISILLFLLLEAASIIGWFSINTDQVTMNKTGPIKDREIRLQCQVATTAARYVSTFIPIIILIIATFCAFRERNMGDMLYETKFLSFNCIALCIIIVAYMPTFQYVMGQYKSIVMAITMDLFAFTFMGCLIFPKVYVAIMKYKRGELGSFRNEDVPPQSNSVPPSSENTASDHRHHAAPSSRSTDDATPQLNNGTLAKSPVDSNADKEAEGKSDVSVSDNDAESISEVAIRPEGNSCVNDEVAGRLQEQT